MEIFLSIAKWPIFKIDRETQPFSKLPGVVLFEAPDTFLVFIEELRASGHTVLSMFAPGGALAISAKKKARVNLESVYAIFHKACKDRPDEVEKACKMFQEKVCWLFNFLYNNTDFSFKPNCEVDRHGKAVNKLSYQPLQVALLLKLLHALSALVKANPARKLLDLIQGDRDLQA